ncbi:MAG: lysylphosphatidylglycerol synthase transmembrane domain-containing protein, partial [Candidatus Nanohaloarchaea archaeon]
MDSRVEKLLWFGVSTAIIGAVIYFADVSKFLEAVRQANGWYLIPALGLGLSVFSIWGFTWYSFFRKIGISISYLKSLRMFMAGMFMNSITPVGQFGGEPFMAYVVERNVDVSYEKAFSTVLSADIVNAVPWF